MTIKKISPEQEHDLLVGMKNFADTYQSLDELDEEFEVQGFHHRDGWLFNVHTTHSGVRDGAVIAIPLEFFENIVNKARELDKLRAEVIDDVI